MLEKIFQSIVTSASASVTPGMFLLCTLASLVCGAAIAGLFCIKNRASRSFAATLALLPAVVQMIIMLVNGNLGTGVAIMGAFSLIRFRSAPGSAAEICSLFLAMAVGLAAGTGYIAYALLFTVIVGGMNLLYSSLKLGKPGARELKITVPEALAAPGAFDEMLARYTDRFELSQVKTTAMGSLFRLSYSITLKNGVSEKALIDDLRTRNGNLEITCGLPASGKDEL